MEKVYTSLDITGDQQVGRKQKKRHDHMLTLPFKFMGEILLQSNGSIPLPTHRPIAYHS